MSKKYWSLVHIHPLGHSIVVLVLLCGSSVHNETDKHILEIYISRLSRSVCGDLITAASTEKRARPKCNTVAAEKHVSGKWEAINVGGIVDYCEYISTDALELGEFWFPISLRVARESVREDLSAELVSLSTGECHAISITCFWCLIFSAHQSISWLSHRTTVDNWNESKANRM